MAIDKRVSRRKDRSGTTPGRRARLNSPREKWSRNQPASSLTPRSVGGGTRLPVMGSVAHSPRLCARTPSSVLRCTASLIG